MEQIFTITLRFIPACGSYRLSTKTDLKKSILSNESLDKIKAKPTGIRHLDEGMVYINCNRK